MTARPIEPEPYGPEVRQNAPLILGHGVVAVPPVEYERIRRRAIAQRIQERGERISRGDFSDFQEVSQDEIAAGQLDG